MDDEHFSAPERASGLIHANVRLTSHFTVVDNRLAQHPKLSMLAIGLAVHLQSLPGGASVGIKTLAARFPESEMRIAGALRELEAHGYVRRYRERLPNGRLAPRTVSYNRPGDEPGPPPTTTPPPLPKKKPVPAPEAEPEPNTPPPPPPPVPVPQATPPPTPAPVSPTPAPLDEAHRPAADLLAGLRRYEPRLLLSERDVQRLTPALTVWFDRGAEPDAVRRTLTACLPDGVRNPAGLLAHRLAALLPTALPALPPPPPGPDPMQDCDDCTRVFRSPVPLKYCRDCREAREAMEQAS